MISDYIIRKSFKRRDKRMETTLVKNLKESKYYVLKQYSHSHLDHGILNLIYNDIEIHQSAAGNGLVLFKEKFYHYKTDTICFVYEFANGDCLKNEILGRKKFELEFQEDDIIQFIYDVGSGLMKFYEFGKFYGCLNLENILLVKKNKFEVECFKLKERSTLNMEKISLIEADLEEAKFLEYEILVEIISKMLLVTEKKNFSTKFLDFLAFFKGEKSLLLRPTLKEILGMNFLKEMVQKRRERFCHPKPCFKEIKFSKLSLENAKIEKNILSPLKKSRSVKIHNTELIRDIMGEKSGLNFFKSPPKKSSTTRAAENSTKSHQVKKKRYKKRPRLVSLSQPVYRLRDLKRKHNIEKVKKVPKSLIEKTLSKLFSHKKHTPKSKSLPRILNPEKIGIVLNPRKKLDLTLNRFFKPKNKNKLELQPIRSYQFKDINDSISRIQDTRNVIKQGRWSFGPKKFGRRKKISHHRKGSIPTKPPGFMSNFFRQKKS